MEIKTAEKIINWLSENGIVSIPLLVLLGFFIVLGLIASQDQLYKLMGRKVSVKVLVTSTTDLLLHSLFIKESKYRALIANSKFGTDFKDEVFRVLLDAKITSSITNTKQLLVEMDIEKMDVRELQSFLYENSRRISEDYNKAVREYLQAQFGVPKGNRVYEYLMNSAPAGFNTIHDPQILVLDQMVAEICRSVAIFRNNIDRFEGYLNVLNSLLYISMTDAENMFRFFNGHLEEILNDKD
jgi:hypothetical protein